MTKKIIATIVVVTIAFVCVFAACNKQEKEPEAYAKEKDLNLVTDENGDKVLDENGAFVVYATDEDGRRVKDDNGEYVTQVQPFEPLDEKGAIEDYGYKVTIPDGWKADKQQVGHFENEDGTQKLSINVVEYVYRDYYNKNKDFYNQLKDAGEDISVTWEDNIDLGKDFKGACRFIMKTNEGTSVLYIFENSRNTYKILFNTTDDANAIADSEAFLKLIEFKPYTYYPDVTSATTEKQS